MCSHFVTRACHDLIYLSVADSCRSGCHKRVCRNSMYCTAGTYKTLNNRSLSGKEATQRLLAQFIGIADEYLDQACLSYSTGTCEIYSTVFPVCPLLSLVKYWYPGYWKREKLLVYLSVCVCVSTVHSTVNVGHYSMFLVILSIDSLMRVIDMTFPPPSHPIRIAGILPPVCG